MDVTVTYSIVQAPLDGVIVDDTLHARPVIQVAMPPTVAVGLLEALADQLGRKVEVNKPEEQAAPSPKGARAKV